MTTKTPVWVVLNYENPENDCSPVEGIYDSKEKAEKGLIAALGMLYNEEEDSNKTTDELLEEYDFMAIDEEVLE